MYRSHDPIATRRTGPSTPEAPLEIPALDATILLVEDNEALRRLVAEILETHGCSVIEAAGPLEALAKIEECRPDLVVTDVIMPKMTGPEMMDRIAKARPGTKVLYLSGYTGAALDGRSDIRTEDVLGKPFSPTELLLRVADLVSEGRNSTET